jgi:hypothetical protein
VTTEVVCESRIESVTVYARGAVVRRRVTLPEALPEEACDVVVPGVTCLADPGSLRASLPDGREILGARARLVVPPRPEADASLARELAELRRRHDELVTERSHAGWRRDVLASVQPEPDLVRKVATIDPAERIADALAIVRLAGDEMSALDAKIAELGRAIEDSSRRVEAAKVALAQASRRSAMNEAFGDAPPELSVVVRLGPRRGAGSPASLDVEYAVLAARWWPTYRARFTEGATRAALSLSALVAQATGEDWSGVRLALSTGDLLRDVRLPELTSLRLGRAQRPRARGYRPPPEGLDAMFEGFDRFVAEVRVTTTVTATVTAAPATGAAYGWAEAPDVAALEYDESADHGDDLDEPTAVAALRDLPARARRASKPRPAAGQPPPAQAMAPGFGGMAPGAPMPSAAPAPMAAAPMAEGASRSLLTRGAPKGGGALFALSGLLSDDEGTLGGGGATASEPTAIEPADAWLDFDSLRIDPGAQRDRRGRLTREAGPSAARAEAAARKIEGMDTPSGATDPRASRGLFDVVYSAAGTADVPSSGRPHRVTIATAEAPASPRFVTVPREAAEVYRRADVTNPFGAPLLTGPVEVLIDGALVALTRLSYTDRGGVISIGLGVEERVRVARNTRVEEGTAGLLGGSTTVEHTVTVDLSSSLGRAIEVSVLDRLPVSDEKDVEIKLLGSQPQASAYTQADLGQPLRKGLRWEVGVPAGGKAKAEWRYRVTLPTKMEIVGGNRRE